MEETKVSLVDVSQQLIPAMGLPDTHYNAIKGHLKKRNEFKLCDKGGVQHTFFYEGEQLKSRLMNGTVQDVFSLSQLKKDTRSEIGMRESLAALVDEKNPDITGEAREAAIDILQEGIDTAKRLVSLGVPFDKARQIVG